MDSYDDLLRKYSKIKNEFETYQNFAESTIQVLNEKNIEFEKKLDALTNIVEISKYINTYVSDENFITVINDMILGILGVTYSSIYIKEDNELIVKATNITNINNKLYEEKYFSELNNRKSFVINCKDPLFPKESKKMDIHSLIGVPITLRDKFIGYIVVEHTLCDFFSYDHIKFISSIANQIGIALENNFLYNKIREASIKDPLLKIYNRKYFFDVIEKMINKNKNMKFSILMMDFDDFKAVNDLYGHQFGDEVLIQTVKLIHKNLENEDIIARYGGEEIVVYINDVVNFEEVNKKIDGIRLKVSKNVIKYQDIKKKITVSSGISYYPQDGNSLQQVVRVADFMLYEAKKLGKNKVVSSKKTK